ncbi:Atp23p [Lipomyces japonicus]|uniref:Atp23p n=1 Tax=Lipomyces japonicus TaxID=56871 RepID=UPI0034CF96BD
MSSDPIKDNSTPQTSLSSSSSSSSQSFPSGFEWIKLKAAYFVGSLNKEEERKYEQEIARRKEVAECQRCESFRDWNLAYSPTITFLRQELRKVGGDIDRNHIVCHPCEGMEGGFNPSLGIMLCQNNLYTRSQVEDVISHELIHAYDEMKFHVDWLNLKHQACSEIRASSLSGECRILNEFMKGYGGFTRHHQACVRRRAVTSVMGNPNCKTRQDAERAVDQVFDSCFNDTRPFEEIYR